MPLGCGLFGPAPACGSRADICCLPSALSHSCSAHHSCTRKSESIAAKSASRNLGSLRSALIPSVKIAQVRTRAKVLDEDDMRRSLSHIRLEGNKMAVDPIRDISGSVKLPGSKSLTNRILLLAALSHDNTRIDNVLKSEDTEYMIKALQQLGVKVSYDWDLNEVAIEGSNGSFQNNGTELFLGNAGTAMRPLTAAIAAAGVGSYVLDGTARMRERPIQDLVDGLQGLGVDVTLPKGTGCPPVVINADGINPGKITLEGNVSSQFLTSLLMAVPLAKAPGHTDIVCKNLISKPYVEMTIKLMQHFNVVVEKLDGLSHLRIPAGQTYKSPGRVFVEGDASSASYWLAGAALTGGRVLVDGCGRRSLQGDVRFASVMEEVGCRVRWNDHSIEIEGPRTRSMLKGGYFDCGDIPDAAMTLAVVAAMAKGPSHIDGVGSWRVKETERMVAIKNELTKLGVKVEEFPESCIIHPPKGGLLPDVSIHTYDDHRMAMAFSLAACNPTRVYIENPKCVQKTYPNYFDVLKAVASPTAPEEREH